MLITLQPGLRCPVSRAVLQSALHMPVTRSNVMAACNCCCSQVLAGIALGLASREQLLLLTFLCCVARRSCIGSTVDTSAAVPRSALPTGLPSAFVLESALRASCPLAAWCADHWCAAVIAEIPLFPCSVQLSGTLWASQTSSREHVLQSRSYRQSHRSGEVLSLRLPERATLCLLLWMVPAHHDRATAVVHMMSVMWRRKQ